MEYEFTFRKSAFQHNLTEADIRHAFLSARFMGQYNDREDVIMVLRFDTKANPIFRDVRRRLNLREIKPYDRY